MPSAMNSIPIVRTLAFRPRPSSRFRHVTGVKRPAAGICRTFADKSTLPEAKEGVTGPNMEQAEHVSEEAAKVAKITGSEGPDIEGTGTPVQEILAGDAEAKEQAPQVMKDAISAGKGAQNAKPSTGRSFSTMARRRADMTPTMDDSAALPPSMFPTAEQRALYAQEQQPRAPQPVQEEKKGHKFPLPALPLPSNGNKDHRYDPVVEQVTNLMMLHGKKSVAQRNMAVILSTLRTAPPPTYSALRPLLPGAPPASHLPLHPVLYLTLAIDSLAPLLRIRSQRGAAGGGVALQIPVPLGLRQRRRTAFTWMLDAASKKKSRGSGNDQFALRVADEVIAVVEGRSGGWEKRAAVHRLGTTARINLKFGNRAGRR
ncbi:hypothetical protein LTR91_003730 [Friedmanniomyces endolithicus]|uniref:Small ribosomal subunit protein uS7m n=1 Tax=Friedmanniomyces endolithicus TaxID=329885 RepID=A0AAN6KWI7_9PEZI|nr:hypothetical protein LTS09_004473 [Friedmanniomyces endolithicus]KAK0334964.1 hypothetical protein LTR94_014777 [Friedmanniomyces endolithicus]KAK0779718.1 hypothetical protein LTR59_013094 [Friedmanniomyces endolithicus]KAK0784605.1 hypothetical protein LTR38_012616 [Friedmanniomyces endolithicus]KAK0859461.1 hypothetical protein LTS02_009177 [Friedmanniomyces endolithicus]